MVRQARVLAQATSDLVNAMRSDAEAEVDVDNSKKLLAAAKLLADATARMVEAAKVRYSQVRCHCGLNYCTSPCFHHHKLRNRTFASIKPVLSVALCLMLDSVLGLFFGTTVATSIISEIKGCSISDS